MKKLIGLLLVALLVSLCAPQQTQATTDTNHPHKWHCIKEDEMKKLVDKGYTKKDIHHACMIGKIAKTKDIEGILKQYKKLNSWEATAQKYGVHLNEIKQHHQHMFDEKKDNLLSFFATYTGVSKETLQTYVKTEQDFRRLVMLSALSKKMNKPLLPLLKSKKTIDEQLKENNLSVVDLKQELLHIRTALHKYLSK